MEAETERWHGAVAGWGCLLHYATARLDCQTGTGFLPKSDYQLESDCQSCGTARRDWKASTGHAQRFGLHTGFLPYCAMARSCSVLVQPITLRHGTGVLPDEFGLPAEVEPPA